MRRTFDHLNTNKQQTKNIIKNYKLKLKPPKH